MSYKDSEESSHQYRAANELSSEIDADDYAVPALEIGSIVALPFLTERQVALATAATNSPFPPQLYVEEVILPRLSEVQQNGKTKLQNELAKPPYERRYFDADSYAAFYLNGVIKKSFGKAHGSVGDKAKIEFWLQDVPRLATLLMARAGRGQDLLQATSRGLPFYGMHVPKLIKKSEVYSAVQKTENEIWKIYWKFLQDWEKPQFAMHHMPLFAMTNITDTFSGRAVVEYFLASTGGR